MTVSIIARISNMREDTNMLTAGTYGTFYSLCPHDITEILLKFTTNHHLSQPVYVHVYKQCHVLFVLFISPLMFKVTLYIYHSYRYIVYCKGERTPYIAGHASVVEYD